MILLDNVPRGYEEIISCYGDPDKDKNNDMDPQWYEENTETYPLPFEMRLSWDPKRVISRVRIHKKVGPAMIDALSEVLSVYGQDIIKNRLNYYGGVYGWRKKRGGSQLSTHAWLIAIDFNPHIGRFGNYQDSVTYPRAIVSAFKERGFVWGGDFNRPDAMHFQACSRY